MCDTAFLRLRDLWGGLLLGLPYPSFVLEYFCAPFVASRFCQAAVGELVRNPCKFHFRYNIFLQVFRACPNGQCLLLVSANSVISGWPIGCYSLMSILNETLLVDEWMASSSRLFQLVGFFDKHTFLISTLFIQAPL